MPGSLSRRPDPDPSLQGRQVRAQASARRPIARGPLALALLAASSLAIAACGSAGAQTKSSDNHHTTGLLTFRGNATRTFYGVGPVPSHPVVKWKYAGGSACTRSFDIIYGWNSWCGYGWTGQPNVVEHPDGITELRIGAYDSHYHFLNAKTGQQLRPDLVTKDLAKGSATSDTDGYPLYYGGSRDNFLRVMAMDRVKPTVLWSVNSHTSVPDPRWNDDWDGAPLQVGDYLLEGGENSWFYVIRLNRGYDAHGKVTVHPKIVFTAPGWDAQLLHDIQGKDISIESSVAFDAKRKVAYMGNGGGLVAGWDIADLLKGGTKAKRVFRFWPGGSVDATIMIAPDGDLIVSRKIEANEARPTTGGRERQVGALMRLDPTRKDPVVWSTQIGGYGRGDGLLATPALHDGVIFAAATEGLLAGVDAKTGKLLWSLDLPKHQWSSPVAVDHTLVVADHNGLLRGYDVTNPRKQPAVKWRLQLPKNVEATPAVWKGMIYVGSRDGNLYAIGDAKA